MSEFGAGIDQENNMLSEMSGRANDLVAHLRDRQEFYQDQIDKARQMVEAQIDPQKLAETTATVTQVGERAAAARGVLRDVYKNDTYAYLKGGGRAGTETTFGVRPAAQAARRAGTAISEAAPRVASAVSEGASRAGTAVSEGLSQLSDAVPSVSDAASAVSSGVNRLISGVSSSSPSEVVQYNTVPRYNLTGDEIDDPEGAVKKVTPNFNQESARQGVIKRAAARGDRPPISADEQMELDTRLGQAKQADSAFQQEMLGRIKGEIELRRQGVPRPSSFDATTGENPAPLYDVSQIDDGPRPPGRIGFPGRKPPQPPSEPPPSTQPSSQPPAEQTNSSDIPTQETSGEGGAAEEGAARAAGSVAEDAAGGADEAVSTFSRVANAAGELAGGAAKAASTVGVGLGIVGGVTSAVEDFSGGHFHLAGDNKAEKTGNALSMASGALDTIGLAFPPAAILGGLLGVGSAISELVGHEQYAKKTSNNAQAAKSAPPPEIEETAAATAVGQVASQGADTLHSITSSSF